MEMGQVLGVTLKKVTLIYMMYVEILKYFSEFIRFKVVLGYVTLSLNIHAIYIGNHLKNFKTCNFTRARHDHYWNLGCNNHTFSITHYYTFNVCLFLCVLFYFAAYILDYYFVTESMMAGSVISKIVFILKDKIGKVLLWLLPSSNNFQLTTLFIKNYLPDALF